MNWGRILLVIGGVVICLCMGESPRAEISWRENLDLPYDAGALDDEEEDAPDIVAFYGQTYEANSIVFCLDESLTMNNESRFVIQRREATRAVSELAKRTEFGILFYGKGVDPFRNTMVTATVSNKTEATRFIASQKTNLGTCLGTAVTTAIRMLRKSSLSHRTVIVVSDGQATECPIAPGSWNCDRQKRVNSQILADVAAANSPGITIHTLFVGQSDICDTSRHFMTALARSHGGTCRTVTQ